MKAAKNVVGVAALAALCAPLAVAQDSGGASSQYMPYFDALFRWAHILFGILWIGHFYFFNFVQAGFEGKLSAEMKKTVVPELRPRALFWFRWGAMWTFASGVGLLGVVYYMGMKGVKIGDRYDGSWAANHMNAYIMVAFNLLGMFFLYDAAAKKLGPFTPAGLSALFILLLGDVAAMKYYGTFTGRALYVHTGALLGTMMMMNVWMRIWPNQRKIIMAVKSGTPPDATLVAVAGSRSRHNTYMSIPLVFFMVSNHYPAVYDGSDAWVLGCIVAVLAIGFATSKMLFNKAGKVVGF